MTEKLTNAQERFLITYVDLLVEVDDVLSYVSECYIKGDVDIGDRLLRDVMKGMLPYHPENMTLVSIFGSDDTALSVLGEFHSAVIQAVEVEERFGFGSAGAGVAADAVGDTGERMRFLHEVLTARYEAWRKVVEKKRSEWESF